MTKTEALKLALEAATNRDSFLKWHYLEESIKEALAQPEQEQEAVVVMELYTVGWDLVENIDIDWLESLPLGTKLYAHPPQRTWVGLTDDEMRLIDPDGFEDNLPQMIQQALKEKNT